MGKTQVIINLQGRIFRTEQDAIDFYGERYETAILEIVNTDDDGEIAHPPKLA